MQSTCGCRRGEQLEPLGGVEPPGVQHRLAAVQLGREPDVAHRLRPARRGRAPDAIAVAHAHPPLELQPVRLQVPARVDGGLRPALGAGREDQEGRARRASSSGAGAGPAASGMSAGASSTSARAGGDDALRHLGVGDLLDARQRDRAEAVQRAHRAEPLRPLRQPHEHDVADADPADVQAGRDAARQLGELRVGEVVLLAARADGERSHSGAMTRASPDDDELVAHVRAGVDRGAPALGLVLRHLDVRRAPRRPA